MNFKGYAAFFIYTLFDGTSIIIHDPRSSSFLPVNVFPGIGLNRNSRQVAEILPLPRWERAGVRMIQPWSMYNAMIRRCAFCLPSPCYSRRGARESFAPVRRRECPLDIHDNSASPPARGEGTLSATFSAPCQGSSD